jgi:hypothetical protein
LPRLRIDQVMTTCLKYCTPIAAAMFAGAMLWSFFLPGGLVGLAGRRVLSRPAGEIREGWLEGPGGGVARDVVSSRPISEAAMAPGASRFSERRVSR